MSWRKLDGNHWDLEYVGKGRSGLVLRLGEDRVIKAPITYQKDDGPVDADAEGNIMSLENEKMTLERLGHHPDIVDWYELRPEGIVMKWMKNGSLQEYGAKNRMKLTPKRVFAWISTVARAIAYCHSQRVLVCDVASRNVLIDEHECAKLCDFTESAILPLDIPDIAEESPDGYSAQTDMFDFGRIVYEIVTGMEYRYDIFFPDKDDFERRQHERLALVAEGGQGGEQHEGDREDDFTTCTATGHRDSRSRRSTIGFTAVWPTVSQLPPVDKLPYGDIMWKCWTKQYRSIAPMLEDISQFWERELKSN